MKLITRIRTIPQRFKLKLVRDEACDLARDACIASGGSEAQQFLLREWQFYEECGDRIMGNLIKKHRITVRDCYMSDSEACLIGMVIVLSACAVIALLS